MALKSVVVDAFFERLIAALRAFQSQRGDLSFVLLSSSHLHRSQWDLTLAADWIDRMSPLKAGAEVTQFLKRELPGSDKNLGRIKIRSTSDLLVRAITSDLDIPQLGTAYRVTGLDLDMFSMDEAVCLLSRPALQSVLPERVSA